MTIRAFMQFKYERKKATNQSIKHKTRMSDYETYIKIGNNNIIFL